MKAELQPATDFPDHSIEKKGEKSGAILFCLRTMEFRFQEANNQNPSVNTRQDMFELLYIEAIMAKTSLEPTKQGSLNCGLLTRHCHHTSEESGTV